MVGELGRHGVGTPVEHERRADIGAERLTGVGGALLNECVLVVGHVERDRWHVPIMGGARESA